MTGIALTHAAFALRAIPGFRQNQSALSPSGVQALRIEHLFSLIFIITALVYAVVMVVLVVSVMRRRQAVSATMEMPAPMPTDENSDRRATRMVAAAMAATVVLLFIMLIGSFLTSRAIASLTVRQPITINVYGHQWWWELNYANAEPDKSFDTANEIHVPVGVPVLIRTASRDVIHSFWAPNIHGKRDLLPGYQQDFWIQADQPGRFRGQCAEFCGEQHAHMAFYIVAEPMEQYRRWADDQLHAAPDPATPQVAHGQQVFLSHTCVMCHTVRGTTAGARTGPDLTHVASRATIAAGSLPNDGSHLSAWITNPQQIKPGVRMPPNPLAPQEMSDLVAYLETLR